MTTVYLLSIRGALAPKTLEAARAVHNETAGAPANVAAARALGDLSHMVYVPMEHDGHHGNEFLILDQWNSLEGLNQFFANPHVQEQAASSLSAIRWCGRLPKGFTATTSRRRSARMCG